MGWRTRAGHHPGPLWSDQLLPALALAASHCAWVISRNPFPLQEFWPLQALFALLHAECPLHELTPSHFTFASSARAVLAPTVENMTAAAAARATPDNTLEFIRHSPRCVDVGRRRF